MNSIIEYILRTVLISIREQFFLIMMSICILRHYSKDISFNKKRLTALVLFGAVLSNLPDLMSINDVISLSIGILTITAFMKYLTKVSNKLAVLITLSSFGVYMCIESLIVLFVTKSTHTTIAQLRSLSSSLLVAALETILQLSLLYFLHTKKIRSCNENNVLYVIMNSKKHFRITILLLTSLIAFLVFYVKLFLFDGILINVSFLQAVVAWTLIVLIPCTVLYAYIESMHQAYSNSNTYTKCICNDIKVKTEKAISIALTTENKELVSCLKDIYTTVDFSE